MIGNFFCALNCCKGKGVLDHQPHEKVIATKTYSYKSLRSATGDFHPSSKIGGGGYGVVHKGVLRDGTQVAIKSLSVDSKQGRHEFMTEIDMISRTRHPNLVELIGFCVEGSHQILVYEFLENNSLASSLLGSRSKYVPLDWPKRAAICLGTASGLRFLHEEAQPRIVHRDIKASNILLDGNFNPKIGDFGLAKLFPDNITHVSTRVAGTEGYLAPEYALLGQLTKKADVYSFGVLMLEIISGKSSSKAAFGENLLVLVEWAWKLKEEKRLLDLVDPNLTNYNEIEVYRFIMVALFCTQATSQHRPNMKQVLKMLSKEVHINEKALTEPGIYRCHSYGKIVTSLNDSSSSSQVIRHNKCKNPYVTSSNFATKETKPNGDSSTFQKKMAAKKNYR
ncbi:PREDICTED: putative serine/threonine-protein kinase isoform X2 [Lupinus angustifolius]|uniref:putative serine/threonine-protein kinase isoform X2 n=1 Tax=Lupinus angustifolius TaxID=3871 RepID=UPI00092FD106|nr:PREDICTED: putative serine/threonine-protein kinase isoform X2 [Lupinus angustifolius]